MTTTVIIIYFVIQSSYYCCLQYADDTQIYLCVTPQNSSSTIPEFQKCLQDIQSWMSLSKLKLDLDKTEFIIFGSEAQRKQLSNLFPTNILGNDITPINKVRNLGVIFEAALLTKIVSKSMTFLVT